MCLAKNIRYLRKKAGLSQEDIAQKLGYKSFTTIQKWESGVAEPSVLIVRKLAEIFGVDMNALTTTDIEKVELQKAAQPEPEPEGWYYDPETARVAQEIYQNPEMHMLFDAARDSKPEDLRKFAEMILLMKRKENYED